MGWIEYVIIGFLLGYITVQLVYSRTRGHGYFMIYEMDEEADVYGICIKLDADQDLRNKKYITLEQDSGKHIPRK